LQTKYKPKTQASCGDEERRWKSKKEKRRGRVSVLPYLGLKSNGRGDFLGWFTWAKGRIRGNVPIFEKKNALLSLVKMRESWALKYVTYTWA
jgi:hypothetical protein